MSSDAVVVAVSTTRGAYLFSSDADRVNWKRQGPFLEEESVNNITVDRNGRYYAATLTEGVFSSDDSGKTWKPSSRGLHVRKVWTVEADRHEDGVLYAGTHYGHLFRSNDSGKSWEEVTGLHNAPNRNNWGIDWGFGTSGLALHTVKSDPAKKGRLFVIPAGKGLYRSDDSGDNWDLVINGVKDGCSLPANEMYSNSPPDATPEQKLIDHMNQTHGCFHKLVLSTQHPGRIYQQNHCGIYMSDDSGNKWNDISREWKTRHGFPIALVEREKSSLFVIPAPDSCKEHNSCIQGKLEVMRTDDAGKTWQHLGKGLPDNVHTVSLRDGMATDHLDQTGVYFGTTSGELYGSINLGESWTRIARELGRIQGVSTTAV